MLQVFRALLLHWSCLI